MDTGKLPPELLARLLGDAPRPPGLLQGPGPGRDAAVVDLGGRYAVLAADPVSFAAQRPGWYAVHVNANDVACLGADPRWFLATVIVPPTAQGDDLTTLFADLHAASADVGAVLAGGHTEVSDAVAHPLIAGTMIGEAPPGRLFPSDGARPGDALLQIGPIAIEGTALLAREATGALRDAGMSPADIDAAAALLFEPGISVLAAARVAWTTPGLHALHDPTEGGIATAAWELAQAAGLGVTLDREAILRHPLTDAVATACDADWLGLLASGALLAAVAPAHASQALAHLHKRGHAAALVGALGQPGQPAILRVDGASRPLPRFWRDEVARVLAPSSLSGADHARLRRERPR